MFKRVEINLDYLSPNRTLIYPLYSEEGEKILDERVVLTRKKIDKIKQEYGNIVYYKETRDLSALPGFRLKIAYNKSREIMEEVSRTQKFSKQSYRDTEIVIEEMMRHLDSSEILAIQLLKDLKSHDDYLYSHSVNVGVLTAVFAKLLGDYSKEEIRYFAIGAFLLDIGAMKVDKQLLKMEGKYDISDMQKMKRHPQLGYEMLKDIPGINPYVLQIILFHHEKFNNRGYYNMPYENLPTAPKIVSICDVYDALTSPRPFREAIDPAKTLKILFNLTGSQFDYRLMNVFLNDMGPLLNNTQSFYGRNDILELNTSELAVVKEFGVIDSLRPTVLIFCKFERQKDKVAVRFYDRPIEIDLQKDSTRSITKFINDSYQIKAIRTKLEERRIDIS